MIFRCLRVCKGNFPLLFPRESPRPPCFVGALLAHCFSGICEQTECKQYLPCLRNSVKPHILNEVKNMRVYLRQSIRFSQQNALRTYFATEQKKSPHISRKPLQSICGLLPQVSHFRESDRVSAYLRNTFAVYLQNKAESVPTSGKSLRVSPHHRKALAVSLRNKAESVPIIGKGLRESAYQRKPLRPPYIYRKRLQSICFLRALRVSLLTNSRKSPYIYKLPVVSLLLMTIVVSLRPLPLAKQNTHLVGGRYWACRAIDFLRETFTFVAIVPNLEAIGGMTI